MRVVPLLLIMIVLGGCRSGVSNSSKAIIGLKDTRAELLKTRACVDKVQAVLTELPKATDVKAAHTKLTAAVEELKTDAADTAEQARQMHDQSRSYIAVWEREVDDVDGVDIASSAAQRRAAVQTNFNSIRRSAEAARDSYRKYVTNLADIQTALENDLTPAGLAMIGKLITTTYTEGDSLKSHIDEVVTKVDAVYAGMASQAGK